MADIKNTLVINLGGIGDLLLSMPALRALRGLYPQARISVLVNQRSYELAKALPYFDEAHIFYLYPSGKIPPAKIYKNFLTLWLLRRKKFDLAINMRTLVSQASAQKMNFLLSIINPKIKAGRDTQGRGWFFDIKIPETDIGDKFEAEYDIDTVEALGAKVIDKAIELAVGKEEQCNIRSILKDKGIEDKDILVGIHPVGMSSHRWPVENFSQVIREINNKINCKFVLTGAKDEVSLAGRLVKITGIKIISLAGRLSFRELAALIERCNIFISNDTSPMHIAAILGTPLVAIFGPGYLRRFDPRNISDKARVLYKKADCAPCDKVVCSSLKCLKSISPQELIEAALGLLHKNERKD